MMLNTSSDRTISSFRFIVTVVGNIRRVTESIAAAAKRTSVLFLVSLLFCKAHAQTFADDVLLYGGNATTVQWGDLDGDGLQDMFIAEGGKHSGGNSVLSWFKAPNWTEYAIGPDLTRFTGDSDIVDIDGDGHLDIVVPRDDHADLTPPGSMQWYKNPGNLGSNPTQNWTKFIIEANVPDAFHQGDLETADVDNDGKMDIVVRSLGVNRFVIYFQNSATSWHKVRINSPFPREGLVVGDLDGDNKVDIIGNGFILFAPSNPRNCIDSDPNDGKDLCMGVGWTTRTFDANFYNARQSGLNNSSKGEVYDMDGDGRLDILQSSAEGNEVYLAWYRNPSNARTGSWARNIIESPQSRNHNVQVGDVDLDGDIDVLGGFSFGSRRVYWWENTNGNATSWARREIDGSNGCYSCVAADYDGDGDIDFAGPTSYARKVYLYRNTTADNGNVLTIAPTAVSFSASGGSNTLSITSNNTSNNANIPWTASSNQPAWLSLSASSGNGDSSVNINATNYTGFGNRTASVTVSNGSISRSVAVSQAGVADSQAPSVPSNVIQSNVSFDSFNLNWNSSNDNSGQVSEYIIYFGGVEFRRSNTNSVSLTGLDASTIYNVSVSAVDPSGNESNRSSALTVVTTERPATPPPFAHWKLDDASGSTALDAAGNNNGALAGGLASNQWNTTSHLLGAGALRFDGGGERVSLGNMDGPTSAITMLGWIRPSAIASNDEGRIISKASGGNANQHFWMLSTDRNGSAIVPRVRLRTGSATTTLLGARSSPVVNNQWSQVAATYDGSIIRLYHNGVEVSSVSASGAIAQDGSVAAVIGNQPAGDRGFVGLIDDLCILDYAISAEDVVFLYNSGVGRSCDSLGSSSNEDITAPVLAEITPVLTPSFETSPGYVFATNEVGVASFNGSCFDSQESFEVAVGEIIFGFEELGFGTYDDCSIIVTDAAGNPSLPLAISSFTILEPDTTNPTVTVNQAADQADPTTSNIARFVVTFSEPINRATFNVSDISLSGTTGRITVGPVPLSGNRFAFSVTGMALDDQVSASIAANQVADLSGNLNEASTQTDNQVTYACDACSIDDDDNDGIANELDNCPADANPDQADSSANGVGNICENNEICFPIKAKNGAVAMICL